MYPRLGDRRREERLGVQAEDRPEGRWGHQALGPGALARMKNCLLYTSDAADD